MRAQDATLATRVGEQKCKGRNPKKYRSKAYECHNQVHGHPKGYTSPLWTPTHANKRTHLRKCTEADLRRNAHVCGLHLPLYRLFNAMGVSHHQLGKVEEPHTRCHGKYCHGLISSVSILNLTSNITRV